MKSDKKLAAAAAWAKTVTDGLGKPIDAGIKPAVIALRALGLNTTMSCEGHMDHGIAGPWVDIFAPGGVQVQDKIMAFRRKVGEHKELPARLIRLREGAVPANFRYAARVLALLEQFYRHRSVPFQTKIILEYWMDGEVRLLCQGAIPNAHRSRKLKAVNLKKYQQEFKVFTKFLMQQL
jgi:hypothetical protein